MGLPNSVSVRRKYVKGYYNEKERVVVLVSITLDFISQYHHGGVRLVPASLHIHSAAAQ